MLRRPLATCIAVLSAAFCYYIPRRLYIKNSGVRERPRNLPYILPYLAWTRRLLDHLSPWTCRIYIGFLLAIGEEVALSSYFESDFLAFIVMPYSCTKISPRRQRCPTIDAVEVCA